MILLHGPKRFVADCTVPYCQLRIRLPDDVWTENTSGGLTVTATVPGDEVKPPTVAVTL